jgi:hypothetical protein
MIRRGLPLKKYKLQKAAIDKFIDSLEEMIDARDDMWEEEKYSNVNAMWKIRDERYYPAKDKLREALTEFIIDVINDENLELQ